MPASHFLRRSAELVQEAATTMKPSDDDKELHISALQSFIFYITIMIFVVILVSIVYTYVHIIPTLCMIESPETAAYVPVDNLERPAPPAYAASAGDQNLDSNAGYPGNEEEEDSADPELSLVHNKPVTSSIRKTILHLRSRGGYWSRFRGLSLFLVWQLTAGIIASTVAMIFHNTFGLLTATVIAEVALARWHLTWVHIVISEPSPKRWYQRIPPWNTWSRIAPAVFLWAVADKIVAVVPLMATTSFGSLKSMDDPNYHPSPRDIYGAGAQGVFFMLLTLVLIVLIQIPAGVTLVRVAASMLPEEDETIVPFDRTFGSKTTPAIVGGKGKIGLVEAWRSFPWASRVRLLKLVAKVMIIILATWMLMLITIVAEAHIMFGDRLKQFLDTIHGPNQNY